MTKTQLKRLDLIGSALDAELSGLGELRDEIQAKFDALGQTAQEGERGQAFANDADALTDMYDALENLISDLQTLGQT